MPQLTTTDLLSLEAYDKARPQIRAKIMEHKKNRTVHLGNHVTLIFEDSLTISYQVQEMLRAERIFQSEGIQEELDAYNPLIPDGSNFKATMMIEYPDVDERQTMLARLKGIENLTWVRVAGFDKAYAIADEDLERENEEKTSSVHFMRFELTPDMVAAARKGAAIGVGVEHAEYTSVIESLPEGIRASLANDLA